jgi:outer membrane protein OmpA-like peptidoglycan-associated protein
MLGVRAEDIMKHVKYVSISLAASVASLVGPGAAAADDAHAGRSAALGELTFPFDSAALGAEAPGALDQVAAFASAHPDATIVLDAHTDPIGASDYNVKLAIRRAEAVRAGLRATGLDDNRIVFAIYGEAGEHHARYANDRRVTIWSTRQPLAIVIDRTFAGSGTAVTWRRPLTVAQIQGVTEPVASR